MIGVNRRECASGAMMCAGAVIGAGFASGRETVQFFTRYGQHGWWLIFLAVAGMVVLSMACMRTGCGCWCGLYADKPVWMGACAKACAFLMMVISGGAMISAAGHMVALVWPSDWAQGIGAVGTVVLAWLASRGRMRPLSVISGLLTLMMVLAFFFAIASGNTQESVRLMQSVEPVQLLQAAFGAAGYAAMNITLSIGVVCSCGRSSSPVRSRTAVLFGFMLLSLLLLSHYLYLLHPELWNEAFPIVRLLASYGRSGFLMSVLLLYLAIFTTLAAVLYGLREAAQNYAKRPLMRIALWAGLPLALSCVGFARIVDRLYAPAGLICLLFVFGPLWFRCGKNSLDNPNGIQ